MALSAVLLALGVVLVVLLLLGEVLLDLLDVLVALRRRREDGGDLEGDKLGIVGLVLGLKLLEDRVVLDRVVDRGGGQQRVEASGHRSRYRACRGWPERPPV